MYKELLILAVGFILGGIAEYYKLRSKIGNEYTIDADIKNKKGQMKDNVFEGTIDLKTAKKEGLLERLKNKRNLKKQNK